MPEFELTFFFPKGIFLLASNSGGMHVLNKQLRPNLYVGIYTDSSKPMYVNGMPALELCRGCTYSWVSAVREKYP